MITAVPAVPLVNQIKARAAALGFDLAGITTAEPPARIEFYRHWVAEGCHGGMDYLARHIEKRSAPPPRLRPARNPSSLLPATATPLIRSPARSKVGSSAAPWARTTTT